MTTLSRLRGRARWRLAARPAAPPSPWAPQHQRRGHTADAILAEWRQRRDAASDGHGHSDLISRLLALPQQTPTDVFVCNDVWLGETDVWGFDLDFTLAEYTPRLHRYIYDAALGSLVTKQRYPALMREQVAFDASFPTRGVSYDPSLGTLIKLDATQRVEVAFYGRRQLTQSEVLERYPVGGHVRHDAIAGMRFLGDHFCYAEAALLADTVDWLSRAGLSFEAAMIGADVSAAVSEVHRSGALYREILRDPGAYVQPNAGLGAFLRRLRSHGKRTFILTNSPFEFVHGVMSHLCGPEWRQCLDVVITQAGKPDWFTATRPFRRVVPSTGRVDWGRVTTLTGDGAGGGRDGGDGAAVFVGGSLKAFVEATRWDRCVGRSGEAAGRPAAARRAQPAPCIVPSAPGAARVTTATAWALPTPTPGVSCTWATTWRRTCEIRGGLDGAPP